MAEVPTNLKYPTQLVEEYGAKAGILMYVASQLPEIPQMPMVVSRINEAPKDFLARADQAGISWPRLFRSSAVVELAGFEGVFPTTYIDTYPAQRPNERGIFMNGQRDVQTQEEVQRRVEEEVERIATSPTRLTKVQGNSQQLPPRINVIAAEVSNSRFHGTMIKSPHLDSYLATIGGGRAKKETFIKTPEQGWQEFGFCDEVDLFNIEDDLERISSWHDQISHLPQMDPNWSYQIEFGANPAVLYQVRPFKPLEVASHHIEGEDRRSRFDPFVLGVTPVGGIDYEAISRFNMGDPVTDLPKLLYSNLRVLYTQDDKSYDLLILQEATGVLEHRDVRMIKQAGISIIYPGRTQFGPYTGQIVNIVSDGRRVQITPLS